MKPIKIYISRFYIIFMTAVMLLGLFGGLFFMLSRDFAYWKSIILDSIGIVACGFMLFRLLPDFIYGLYKPWIIIDDDGIKAYTVSWATIPKIKSQEIVVPWSSFINIEGRKYMRGIPEIVITQTGKPGIINVHHKLTISYDAVVMLVNHIAEVKRRVA